MFIKLIKYYNIIKSYSNFIEEIIEKDIKGGLPKKKIRFRFPPEPNGYLHIGHIKAIHLNFSLGKKYNSPVNLRFDDTNPNKEYKKFIEHIKKDILFLGFKWDKESYASDYFQNLYNLAIKLIQKDKAYVDQQSKNIIKFQRKNYFEIGIDSINRNRSIEENLYLFEKMKNGFFKEGSCVLRAKIDMKSSNINMRDPIMYRIIKKSHNKTKKNWCIYPTYDWAHGQCDYFEQISHSLCSLEFENKRPLYNWFLNKISEDNIKKIKPKQIEFSRLNLSHTLTSKRKIQYLIDKNIINSWDDPRIPTISGLRKKGYTSTSLKNFVKKIGITKRENIINFSFLEFQIKKHLNKIAHRIMVVLQPIKLIISNYPENKIEWLKAENNPENTESGYRKIPFCKELYIEKNDFLEEKKDNFFRLYIGNEVRLKNAYIIKANYIKKDNKGKIKEIYCTYDPKSKSGKSKKKVKSTIHWVSIKNKIPINVTLYHQLFIYKNPNVIKDLNKYINYKSKEKIIGYAEPYIKKAVKLEEYFQFQRIGYFHVDKIENELITFIRTASLKNKWDKNINNL